MVNKKHTMKFKKKILKKLNKNHSKKLKRGGNFKFLEKLFPDMYVKEKDNSKTQNIINQIIYNKNLIASKNPGLADEYLQNILEFLFNELSYENSNTNKTLKYLKKVIDEKINIDKKHNPQANRTPITSTEIINFAKKHQEEYSPLEYNIIS